MRKGLIYAVCCLLLVTVMGCTQKKKTNWQVTLKKEDKTPYGTYLAYNSLKYYFPQAEVQTLSRWHKFNTIADEYDNDGTALLILSGLDFNLSGYEWEQLQQFISSGNEVMIFGSNFAERILDNLQIAKYGHGEEYPLNSGNTGKDNIAALSLVSDTRKYGYEGHFLQGYFGTPNHTGDEADGADSVVAKFSIKAYPDTLGYTKDGPNFLRFGIGDGHLTLHAAPLVLSNYFLLQPGNRQYLDGIWRTLPVGMDYYKRSAERSDFDLLWRHPATRWALILAVATLLLYVFFESKRRQRIIPIVDAPENTSVSFVETVGRLYYNKGDHHNLAEKMVQHFLEWVRANYHLNTSEINETFIVQLRSKSGLPETVVRRTADMIHEVRLASAKVDETYLYELYTTIQQFYNTKNK
jgi:hypothetical protein